MKRLFPQIERIAVDSSISYFLLMFGYKLLSTYFSLYLLQLGLSITKIGYTYLLIYLPIALAAPFVGALLYRVSPVVISSLGIAGYGFYSIGLLVLPNWFNALQIILGISAALFLVSTRVTFIRARLANYDAAFGLFYSAPNYAQFLAPIAAALLIKFFGFPGVFIASFAVHVVNIIFSSHRFAENNEPVEKKLGFRTLARDYTAMLKGLKSSGLMPIISVSFIVLIVEGFYSAFFIVFLKNHIGFSDDAVLLYGSLLSVFSVFTSFAVAHLLKKRATAANLAQGGLIHAVATILIGTIAKAMGFAGMLIANMFKGFGGLIISSARSGKVSESFPNESEEAAVFDTIFSPLGTAIGAFAGGFIVAGFGYNALFVGGGLLILFTVVIMGLMVRKNH